MELKNKFHLCQNTYFAFIQFVNSLPVHGKKLLKQMDLSPVIYFFNLHVIRMNNLLTLEKLNSREIYTIIVKAMPHTPM